MAASKPRISCGSHNLKRIADRVTNISERVVFLVTGKMAEMKTSSDHASAKGKAGSL